MKKILLLCVLLSSSLAFAQTSTVILPDTAYWKYWDKGFSIPDSTRWRTDTTYSTTAWGYGKAPLGYMAAGSTLIPTTTLSYGPDISHKYRTTYFRRELVMNGYLDGGDAISHPAVVYKMRVQRDDGIAVYVNGKMVYHDKLNLPFGYHTLADLDPDDNGQTWHDIYLDPHIFNRGKNIISVEVHQWSDTSSDLWFALELTALNQLPFAQQTLPQGSEQWRVWYPATEPDNVWKTAIGMDTNWGILKGEFGFGDADEETILNYGTDPNNKYRTAYFRKVYNISSLANLYKLKLKYDDAIAVWLNGKEIFRDNFNTYDKINYNLLATQEAADDGNIWREIYLPNSYFITGQNLLAIEVHLKSPADEDMSFNAELVSLTSSSAYVIRGPYLQKGTPTSMRIKWKTNIPSDGLIRYGTELYYLNSVSATNPSATNQTIELTGLQPNTKYYYAIENSTGVLEKSLDNYFITPPTVGSEKKTKIWAMGCFGSGKLPQRMVQERLLEQLRNQHVDFAVQMGDLAYYSASEDDFQKNYFEVYQTYRTMKQTPIYPSIGNHEYGMVGYNYSNLTGLDYYNVYDLYTNAEAGGLASGTERYYSFNYGNIHVVSLDPHGREEGTGYHVWENGSRQRQWLIDDLTANTQKWTIILIHTPPYTKGKHDSDNPTAEPEMWGVRNNLVDVFDQFKVDLVLSAHSHNYERSKLIKGFKLTESNYNASYEVSSSSGKYDGSTNSCAYQKNTTNGGTIYAVVGSGGRLETGVQTTFPHDAVSAGYDVTRQGSYLIEIEGNRMDVRWVSIEQSPNMVLDKFTVFKDLNLTTETITVPAGATTATITAPWTGNYSWSNGEATKSITVPANTTTFTVKDGATQCFQKTYNIVSSCGTNLNITSPINSGTILYEVSQTITASNVISGGSVKYDAGKSILLTPGFSVSSGTVFKAYIEGCGGTNQPISPKQ